MSRNPVPDGLRRQGSSFALRTSRADQEQLAANALRSSVTVLKSGVQIERIKVPVDVDALRQTHRKQLKDIAQRYDLVWRVRLFDSSQDFAGDEEWKLRNVSRGIRDALLTGEFIPGARLKTWIPAELGGWWVKSKARVGNDVAFEVEVLSVDKGQSYAWTWLKGLLGALVTTFVSFLWIQVKPQKQVGDRRKISNSSTLIPEGSTHFSPKHRKDEGFVSAQVGAVKSIEITFGVDTIDFGEALVEVCEKGKCGAWFVKNLERFIGQDLVNLSDTMPSGGLLVTATEAASASSLSTDRELIRSAQNTVDNEEESFSCEELWIASAKGLSPYRLFLDPFSLSLSISKERPASSADHQWICIGCVVTGDDNIEAVLNCDDGGLVSFIKVNGSVILSAT